MTDTHDFFNPRQITSKSFTPADIAKDMLAGWGVVIPTHYKPDLTPARQVQLNSLFTKVFDSKLIRWLEFVDLIAENEFLMSKVAGGNIDWALANYEMILAGDYPGGANDSSSTDAAPAHPAAPATPVPPAAPTEPTAPAINGEKEYSHGGMLARRVPKAGS